MRAPLRASHWIIFTIGHTGALDGVGPRLNLCDAEKARTGMGVNVLGKEFRGVAMSSFLP